MPTGMLSSGRAVPVIWAEDPKFALTPELDALHRMLVTYEGNHFWEIRYYGNTDQMSFWWDGRPVYIF